MRRAVCVARAKESDLTSLNWVGARRGPVVSGGPNDIGVSTVCLGRRDAVGMAPARSKVYASPPPRAGQCSMNPSASRVQMRRCPSSRRRRRRRRGERPRRRRGEKQRRMPRSARGRARRGGGREARRGGRDESRAHRCRAGIRAVLAKGLAPREQGQAKPGDIILRVVQGEPQVERRGDGGDAGGEERVPSPFRRARRRGEQDKVIAAMRGLRGAREPARG